LFNSFSRACLKIEKDELVQIKNILKEKTPLEGKNKKYQDVLVKNGFVVPNDANEIEVLEYLYNASYFVTDKITVALVPSLKCNFKCPYCFEAREKAASNETDDYFDILKKFADKNFLNKKKVHISLFGGEPLLKKKEILSYLRYLSAQSKKYGYKLSTNIVTNGFLLDKKTAEELFKYNCSAIQITLDGGKESHDKLRILHNNGKTFDIIVDNFKNALQAAAETKAKTHFIIRVNLLNQSVEDVRSIFNAFDKKERKRIAMLFRPVYATSCFGKSNANTSSDLKKFNDEAKKYGFAIMKNYHYLQYCESHGGPNFFYVNPDLKIWKCVNEPTGTANIGHIDKTGDLHLNPSRMAKWHQGSNPFKDEKCRKCYYLPVCYGGCPLYHIKTGKRKCVSKDMSVTPYFYC
jgi:uncharacterized protein